MAQSLIFQTWKPDIFYISVEFDVLPVIIIPITNKMLSHPYFYSKSTKVYINILCKLHFFYMYNLVVLIVDIKTFWKIIGTLL